MIKIISLKISFRLHFSNISNVLKRRKQRKKLMYLKQKLKIKFLPFSVPELTTFKYAMLAQIVSALIVIISTYKKAFFLYESYSKSFALIVRIIVSRIAKILLS